MVEDNDDDRELIKDMIESAIVGSTVTGAATGDEALAHFRENGADCVILDDRLELKTGSISLRR